MLLPRFPPQPLWVLGQLGRLLPALPAPGSQVGKAGLGWAGQGCSWVRVTGLAKCIPTSGLAPYPPGPQTGTGSEGPPLQESPRAFAPGFLCMPCLCLPFREQGARGGCAKFYHNSGLDGGAGPQPARLATARCGGTSIITHKIRINGIFLAKGRRLRVSPFSSVTELQRVFCRRAGFSPRVEDSQFRRVRARV